ncbi:triose-phosphate isomerase [Candidatus Saccharibacteria bacterium]|nr:triose-phosphate isomerase [Candidatus Saccharibacteria bacterium]
MAKIFLTAQNIDVYEGDNLDMFARTGETTADQVYRAGASGLILGHSEVGDSPAVVRKKLLTICNQKHTEKYLLNNTLLIGETWEEYQDHSPAMIAEIVNDRLVAILKNVPKKYLKSLVIGYEPKWGSRGSGHDNKPPPSSELISVVCQKIHSVLIDFNCSAVPIIYGGRSTSERTEEILADKNIEGLILGSACNSVEKTMDIANVMTRIRPNKRKVLHANFKAYNLADSYQAYLKAFMTLDNNFTIYISPCHTDLREVAEAF